MICFFKKIFINLIIVHSFTSTFLRNTSTISFVRKGLKGNFLILLSIVLIIKCCGKIDNKIIQYSIHVFLLQYILIPWLLDLPIEEDNKTHFKGKEIDDIREQK